MTDEKDITSVSDANLKADEDHSTCEEVPPNSDTIGSDNPASANDGSQTTPQDNTKIAIVLRATGNAPIMRKKKWFVNQDQHVGWISEFIKKYLKLDSTERLFLYINQTFAPAPDQSVKNLYDCYGAEGKLILHYCKSQAWG